MTSQPPITIPSSSDAAEDEGLVRCYRLLRQRAKEHRQAQRQNESPMTGNLAGTTIIGPDQQTPEGAGHEQV